MLQFLDIFFFVFHTAFTLFNMAGWMFRKTRKWHLLTLLLTALSWFVLGLWYGLGYCLCTDWHMDVRRQLGYYDDQQSYIHFLLFKLTGIDFGEKLVETVTLIVFILIVILSVVLNIRDYRKNKSQKAQTL